MIVTTGLELFRILKERLGETEAEALVYFVDGKLKVNDNTNIKTIATKEDFYGVEKKILEDFTHLITKIEESTAEIIKWMFLFWIGQIAVTFGFILLFIKK